VHTEIKLIIVFVTVFFSSFLKEIKLKTKRTRLAIVQFVQIESYVVTAALM